METDRLRQFCLIVDTQGLTSAAELLGITHSALSKSMRVLGEQLDVELFQPKGRGITPTEEGLRVYKNAKLFLEQENTLFRTKLRDFVPQLRIGVPETLVYPLIAAEKKRPLSSNGLTLIEIEPGEVERRISEGNIDFGITHAPYPGEGNEVISVGKYRLGIYAKCGVFANKPLEEIPFVAPATGFSPNPLGVKERDGWSDELYPRKKKYFVNLLSAALELSGQGNCAICIPRFVAAHWNKGRISENQLVELRTPKQIPLQTQSLFIVKSVRKKEDQVLKRLVSILRTIISM